MELVEEPEEGGGGVVVGGGDAVFWPEAVVEGEHDGAGLVGEAEAAGVHGRPRAAADAEPAAVEVCQHA